MFGQRETNLLQRTIPVVAGIIGVACCLLALMDMRSQQVSERAPAKPAMDAIAGQQEPHRMRGWQVRRRDTNGATQRVQPVASGLS